MASSGQLEASSPAHAAKLPSRQQPPGQQDGEEAALLHSVRTESFASEAATEDCAQEAAEWVPEEAGGCSVSASTLNLCNTIVGAGIMALPRAVASLGLILGVATILAVYGLSQFSLATLVRASEKTKQWSYADLMASQFGPLGGTLLQVSILVNNAGLMIMYLIIMGDVLVGKAPGYSGLLTNLLADHSGQAWYLSRYAVLAITCLLFLLPLVLLRRLGALAAASAVSLVLALAFSATVVALAATAAAQGAITDIHLLPNPEFLGQGALAQLVGLFTTMPVLMTAYVAHYNLHPLMGELAGYTEARMMRVVRWAMAACSAIYVVVASAAYLTFGNGTADDVLQNFTPQYLAPLLGRGLATGVGSAVWLAYLVSLLVTYPLVNWALRDSLVALAWPGHHLSGYGWYTVTFGILVVMYGVAVLLPSIWTAMSISGATASVALAFAFPAALVLKMEGPTPRSHTALAVAMLAIGGLTSLVTIVNTLFGPSHGQ